jgi:hypothetical protein
MFPVNNQHVMFLRLIPEVGVGAEEEAVEEAGEEVPEVPVVPAWGK